MTAVAAAGAKGITVLTTLVSVPLTLGYLGEERYGLWMTISSVFAILAFADLGLGNGLVNAISEADGKDDRQLARQCVSSALLMLSGVAALLCVAFAIAYPYISWERFLNVSSARAIAEAGPAMTAFVACFLISMPVGVVARVQMGYQEGFANSLWSAAGNFMGLAAVLVAIYLRASLAWLVLAMAGTPVIANLANAVVLFGYRRPWLLPRVKAASLAIAAKLLRLGLLFFILQIAVAMAYASDNLVISQVLGSAAVTQYSVPARLFSIPLVVIGMVLGPLWPAYGEAFARGDVLWAKKMLVRSLAASAVLATLAAVPLVVFGSWLLHVWAGKEIHASWLLLAGLGIWSVLNSVGNALAMALNGANVIRFQVITASLMAILALGLKIGLARALGVPGVIWATVIAYSVVVVLPCAVAVPGIFRAMEHRRSIDPSQSLPAQELAVP